MIIGFADKETEQFWQTGHSRRIPANIQARAYMKLQQLDAAATLDFLKVPPSNQLEKLKGAYKNHYSIRVNRQWRIVFRFEAGEAQDVAFVDYH